MRRAKIAHGGNCVRTAVVYECRRCGVGNFCDVCHQHEAARGECGKCGEGCRGCEEEARLDRASKEG